MTQSPCALIIGGSSGLGALLAKRFTETHRVTYTGRRVQLPHGQSDGPTSTFFCLNLTPSSDWQKEFDEQYYRLLKYVGRVDVLVFAAGFYQEKPLEELADEEIMAQYYVGPLAYQLLVRRILAQQEWLAGNIVVTSTSATKARLDESPYCASKAGLNMAARCAGLSPKVGKTLIVAPGGMNTQFYRDSDRDTSNFLDPVAVADLVMDTYHNHSYELCTYSIPRPNPGESVRPEYVFEERKRGSWSYLFRTREITPEISNFIASIG